MENIFFFSSHMLTRGGFSYLRDNHFLLANKKKNRFDREIPIFLSSSHFRWNHMRQADVSVSNKRRWIVMGRGNGWIGVVKWKVNILTYNTCYAIKMWIQFLGVMTIFLCSLTPSRPFFFLCDKMPYWVFIAFTPA